MDPLSLTAGVIAVVQLASKVVEYISAAAGATKERKRLGDEVRACEFVLQQLKDDAQDAEEGKQWSETIQILDMSDGPLGRLRAALRILIVRLEPKNGLRESFSSLKWPFTEREVEKIISTIEREKSLLDLALSNNCR